VIRHNVSLSAVLTMRMVSPAGLRAVVHTAARLEHWSPQWCSIVSA
jgi:hypothetical protein